MSPGWLRFYCGDSSLLSLRTPVVLYFYFCAAVGELAHWGRGLRGAKGWGSPRAPSVTLAEQPRRPSAACGLGLGERPPWWGSLFHPSPWLLSSSFLNSDDKVTEPNCLQNPPWLSACGTSHPRQPCKLSVPLPFHLENGDHKYPRRRGPEGELRAAAAAAPVRSRGVAAGFLMPISPLHHFRSYTFYF